MKEFKDGLVTGIHNLIMNLEPIKFFVFIFFILHIVLKFNVGYENRDSEMIMDRRQISSHYLGGWFWFDLVVSFPFNFFNFIPLIKELEVELLLLRLLRVVNVLEILNALSYMSINVFKSKVILLCTRIFSIFIALFCVAHLGACLWFYLGEHTVNIFFFTCLLWNR